MHSYEIKIIKTIDYIDKINLKYIEDKFKDDFNKLIKESNYSNYFILLNEFEIAKNNVSYLLLGFFREFYKHFNDKLLFKKHLINEYDLIEDFIKKDENELIIIHYMFFYIEENCFFNVEKNSNVKPISVKLKLSFINFLIENLKTKYNIDVEFNFSLKKTFN